MLEVVGVRFKEAGKIYYFAPGQESLSRGQSVIVETVRGIEYGEVVIADKQMDEEDVVLPLKSILRVADDKDAMIVRENKMAAFDAHAVCVEKIREHKLDMKLVDVEYTFDRNKVIFYFTAEGRVDFRELVKDLAAVFRTRIELRQIGVRDEAKLLGGIGPCGRVLCCSSFLGEFEPVSIKMAKDQNLSLNPTKISGVCGRLMCCLKYENDTYEEMRRDLPDYGKRLTVPEGEGRVVGLNILDQIVQIELKDRSRVLTYSMEELLSVGAVKQKRPKE
ncbi:MULTISPECIES: stage 0 sporulation family protein [Exiguobacterium]|uniref:PSP1 domain protein n=1 Tax=Exiguobacterium sibiricum (strain DSM 17290 / CCUG 55495 / CIP 109462 / JCM 13490 / 255-15) TaxID=262543 RepID=B1YGD6_EXIS2|nr:MULTISPECIES: stage 0 sporulation family protein [Exiguobacterium]ACB59513.1 PSP1 domain protein [Exiguobacterium sibiricum 255-15]MCT4793633.1 stage 0 sporulation family protein [Exiguobacterium artemiae]MDW2886982.1 stage 0 sporulation family protein [Exiguobacterium sibiricum]MDX1261131.1 stage 0 sporulation family protein [Exiguobacterium sp. K1]RDB32011.1 stage 0 sporulation protein [Exiguobacterium sp. RIT594]